jgi:hypothetical protein
LHSFIENFAAIGLDYNSINTAASLQCLDTCFFSYINERHPDLSAALQELRAANITKMQHSELALSIAPALDDFLCNLFPVVDANSELAADAAKNRLIFDFKRQVVERAARKRLRQDQPLADFHALSTNLRS